MHRVAWFVDSVAATCSLAPAEELQLLETSKIVLSESHEDFDPRLHDPHTLALVQNRLFALSAAFSGLPDFEVGCWAQGPAGF